MSRILIFSDYYLPGYKSGGAMRTIVNMVERLGDRYDFHVLTRGFDVGEKDFYPDIKINDWNKIGKSKIFHAAHGQLNFATIRRVIKEAEPDAVYLTSFFSPLGIKFLTLRRLGMTPDVPVILAPEGEFSPGALQLKATKKKIFRKLAFPGRLYRDLIWKAASEPEREDVRRVAGEGCEIFIAPNMPPRVILESYAFEQKPLKREGAARLVFLSRVVPKKNVLHTLELLPSIEGEIVFDIYGPLEDEAYWNECQQLIAKMPPNIKVTHRGSIPYEAVAETMTGYHYFVLPTLGENFGHVMPEAFSAGCPVLISDQTPWRNLSEKNIGWDLPLERADLWREALQECVKMSGAEYERQSRAARRFAIDWLAAPEIVAANARVLDRALEQKKEAISSAA
ncbi:MAG: glycosyltransferase family 4 protein [Acidobacteria bacterium]|nr:glycosyltransferase family 4 protein [Acidobacteriota bacterium]